jgi:hypothetical protein
MGHIESVNKVKKLNITDQIITSVAQNATDDPENKFLTCRTLFQLSRFVY